MVLFQTLILPGGKKIAGPEKFAFKGDDANLGAIVSKILNTYIFFFAGLILLLMLIMGGFQMLTSAGDPEKVKAGQGKITTAVIGFLIVFAAYWLMQIIEVLLGFKILE